MQPGAPRLPIDTGERMRNSRSTFSLRSRRVTYETIDLQVRDRVAWITLNRPQAFNALDLQMAKDLFAVSNRLSSDRSVRCAVLTGSGAKAFCAGGDVAGFGADPATVDQLVREMTTPLHAAVSRFAAMNAPLIAAVNGVAAGAGLGLARMRPSRQRRPRALHSRTRRSACRRTAATYYMTGACSARARDRAVPDQPSDGARRSMGPRQPRRAGNALLDEVGGSPRSSPTPRGVRWVKR